MASPGAGTRCSRRTGGGEQDAEQSSSSGDGDCDRKRLWASSDLQLSNGANVMVCDSGRLVAIVAGPRFGGEGSEHIASF